MRDEVVVRRRWVDDAHFLDLLGATNLIPGPNSTEMAIHLGYVRAGWRGLVLGGLGFILPAAGIVMVLAHLYVRYGQRPEAGWMLAHITPVVIVIIAQAAWELSKKAMRGPLTAAVGLAALGLSLAGAGEIAVILAGGVVVMLARNAGAARPGMAAAAAVAIGASKALAASVVPLAPAVALAAAAVPFSLERLFWSFLRIGSILYGSGYVLVAFVHTEFVTRLGWLTDQQLLDAVAIGQVTPGPLFTSATFIGYLLGGVSGATIASVAIFLPSFVFVAATNPLIPRMRRSRWLAALLDGVNAASIGLIVAVTLRLARPSLFDPLMLALAALAAVLLFRYKVGATRLVLLGAAIGLARGFFFAT